MSRMLGKLRFYDIKNFNPFLSTQMVSAEMSPCPFLPAHSIGRSQEWKKHSYLLSLNSTLQGKGQKNLREPELTVSRDTCLLLKTGCSTPGYIPGSQLGKGGWLYFPAQVLKLLSIPKLSCSFQIEWMKINEILPLLCMTDKEAMDNNMDSQVSRKQVET